MKNWVALPAAVLAGVGIVATQACHGGLLFPVLAIPGFFFLGFAALLAAALLGWKDRGAPRLIPLLTTAAFAAWLLWRAASGPPTADTDGWLRLILACAVMYFLFASAITGSRERLAFFTVLFLAAVVQSGVGAWQFLRSSTELPIPWLSEQLRIWYETLGETTFIRARGFYINGIHLAWFLNIASLSALAVACWSRWPVWARVFAAYVAAVGFAVCLATLSRGGYIGLAVGVCVFLAASVIALISSGRGYRWAIALTTSAALLVAVGSAYLVLSESFAVQSRLAILASDVYRPRVLLATNRVFQENPLLGGGVSAFKEHGRVYRSFASATDDTFAHNDWAQIASDFGYPALALLLLLVASHFASGVAGIARCARTASQLGRMTINSLAVQIAALAALAPCVAHAFFDFSMQIPANALMAAALAGMLANPGFPAREGPGHPLLGTLAGGAGILAGSLGAAILLLLLVAQGPREYTHLQASNALLRGDPDPAIAAASLVLADHPNDFDFRTLRARAFLEKSTQARDAAAFQRYALSSALDYRAAALVHPLDPFQSSALATAEGRIGRFQFAEAAASRTIALFPLYGAGYYFLGLALEGQGLLPQAAAAYHSAIFLPETPDARQRLQNIRERLAK